LGAQTKFIYRRYGFTQRDFHHVASNHGSWFLCRTGFATPVRNVLRRKRYGRGCKNPVQRRIDHYRFRAYGMGLVITAAAYVMPVGQGFPRQIGAQEILCSRLLFVTRGSRESRHYHG
jgi:hypothetical protein